MDFTPASNVHNLRDFKLSSRSDRTKESDKLPSGLTRALALLHLSTLDELEQRFLSTSAFLTPWSLFRDSILLLQPDAMAHATQISRSTEITSPVVTSNQYPVAAAQPVIKRLDILWFYTQFDEGTLRYDPRADKWTAEYTPDTHLHGVIDKTAWGLQDYEKHLYAWLLQEFKVGKARNPFGFAYFELRNICTVWEDVFVPIINAVRAAYSAKGRRYYGRLATFVEERCPSRLAFPEDNVVDSGMRSPTPFRIVSVPKKRVNSGGATFFQQFADTGSSRPVGLTRKQYDEAEKELRDVYPQYGGLVERPRFKQKMEDWLAVQRERARYRKAVPERLGEVKRSQPKVTEREGDERRSSDVMGCSVNGHEREGSSARSRSPVKRLSDSIRRSMSRSLGRPSSSSKTEIELTMSHGQYGYQSASPESPKLSPKSPLHGVTRPLHFPDSDEEEQWSHLPPRVSSLHQNAKSLCSIHTHSPPSQQQRQPSGQSVYTSVRNSDTFNKDLPDLPSHRLRAATEDSLFSPMGPLSAIPRPLWGPDTQLPIRSKKSFHDNRIPSYAGSGYEKEISLTDLHNSRVAATHSPSPVRKEKTATRLPAPILPAPYVGKLRAASKDSPHTANAPPKPVAWLGHSPPRHVAWPGFESDENLPQFSQPPPPVPTKSPERWKSARGHVHVNSRSEQLVREDSQGMMRIVSKENIRAALADLSRESSMEELAQRKEALGSSSERKIELKPYNRNMFPRKEERKGTPMGG